jgi:hypothetical protein
MKTGRFDIHQHITDKIVSAIERGAGDFRLPWHRSAGSILRPVKVASRWRQECPPRSWKSLAGNRTRSECPPPVFVCSNSKWIELWQILATSIVIANPSRIGLVTRTASRATTIAV